MLKYTQFCCLVLNFYYFYFQGFSESEQTDVKIHGPLEAAAVQELIHHAKGDLLFPGK